MHAALLHTGKLLFAAGSGNSAIRFADANFGNTTMGFWTSVVWDPTVSPPPGQHTNFFHPDTKRDGQGKVLDFFCGGETPLEDGRLLATGGTSGAAVNLVQQVGGIVGAALFVIELEFLNGRKRLPPDVPAYSLVQY